MIKFGSLKVKDIRIGEQQVKKVAVGSEVVWEKNASPLPSGYTQVKYLQSVGTDTDPSGFNTPSRQYINTGYKANNNVGCKFKFQLTILKYNSGLTGSYTANVSRFYPICIDETGNICYVKTIAFVANFIETFNQNIHEVSYNVENGEIIYDGNVIDSSPTIGTDATMNIFIFGRSYGRNTQQERAGCPCKIYYYKLYDNGTLVRNFVPCLDTNNRPCFYDTVTQQTFYNAGTGTFGYETMDGTVVAPI